MNQLKKFLFGISRGEVLLPRLRDYLSKEHAEIKAGRRTPREGVVEDADLTIACFRDRKAEYNHQGEGKDDRTKDYFHPSQIGRCPREMFFSAMGLEVQGHVSGDEHLRTHLIFEIGTYAHVMFQNLCERAGTLAEREVQVVCHVNKIVGHCDGKLELDNSYGVLEFKTINERGWSKLTTAKQEHIEQATIYMALLELEWCVVVYFNKNTQELREFRVAFDKHLWEKTIKSRIKAHQNAVKNRIVPPRIPDANPNKFPCSYCAHQRTCFDSTAFAKFLKSSKAKAQP